MNLWNSIYETNFICSSIDFHLFYQCFFSAIGKQNGVLWRSRGAKLIFEDDFDRVESQEEKDEPGNGWTTNSAKRSAGNKPVDLADGTVHISIHKAANHDVSVVHDAEFIKRGYSASIHAT